MLAQNYVSDLRRLRFDKPDFPSTYLSSFNLYSVVNSKNFGPLYSTEKAKTGKMYPKNEP